MTTSDLRQILDDARTRIAETAEPRRAAAVLIAQTSNDRTRRQLATLYRSDEALVRSFVAEISLQHGLKGHVDNWFKAVRAEAKAQAKREAADARANAGGNIDTPPLDTLTEGLGVSGLITPPGYRVDHTGVWLLDDADDDTRVASAPVIITGATQDIGGLGLSLRLAWTWKGKWCSSLVSRDVAMDARSLQKLAASGIPVTSSNATRVIQYLDAFEVANLPLIEVEEVSSRMGWLGPSRLLVGMHCYGGETRLAIDPEDEFTSIANAFGTRGDPDEWDALIRDVVAQHPLVMLGIYTAAAAPLLSVLGVRGFTVDWSGPVGRGKSKALEVGASVWGDPDELVGTWATSSEFGPQVTAGRLYNLPLILDDTKEIDTPKKKKIAGAMVYGMHAGKGRLQGNASGGTRKRSKWWTLLMSTGERAITEFSENSGERRRALCVRGAPMGSAANRAAAELITATTLRTHGHLGAKLAECLIALPKADLKARHFELAEHYAARATGSVAGSLANAVAVIHLTAEICHSLGLPGELAPTMEVVWETAEQMGEDSYKPLHAWHDIHSWCVANRNRLWSDGKGQTVPVHGWAGTTDMDHRGQWEILALRNQEVKQLLSRWGYDVANVTNEWKRKGWASETPRPKLAGSTPRMLSFMVGEVGE